MSAAGRRRIAEAEAQQSPGELKKVRQCAVEGQSARMSAAGRKAQYRGDQGAVSHGGKPHGRAIDRPPSLHNPRIIGSQTEGRIENRGIRALSPIIVRSGSDCLLEAAGRIAVVVSIWTIDALQTFAEGA